VPLQRADVRRYGLGQDDAAELPDRTISSDDERIITCEDAGELQLQQPHVVRLETRPPNLEGLRPDHHARSGQELPAYAPRTHHRRRGARPEAFDLLQAMNTGHDGSMGTLHANNPREAISRMENMIAMGGLNLPF
jgi:pilus assembly protein CpaF